MSYSQGEEQQHILQHVPDCGRFLDIGAWHAKNLSNTRALYERGWQGVMIEPSPEPFLGLMREYGNDPAIVLICGAVGVNADLTKFHCSSDALTTSEPSNFEKWKEVGGFYGTFFTKLITLEEIIHQFGAFDFVSIDAEGTSVEIFQCLLATGMRPAAICVEHDSRTEEILPAAEALGYKAVYSSAENVVLAR